jgi:iron complex outermembrane receptor protein
MKRLRGAWLPLFLLLAVLAGVPRPAAASAGQSADSAADLSLEDLLNTEVVTAARKPESLHATAAAAYVITHEDIARSGATNIPEALRLAPGVEVAQIGNNRWAVTVRGFNGRFADKLLVLMDGRSIYSPLFSGVMWEFEDTLLDEVERIEVIRGPGAAIWGANAVNGVINIITRKARDTQGELAVAQAGSDLPGQLAYRHGGETTDGYYRAWGKAFAHDASVDAAGQRGNDYWRSARAGFRRDGASGAGSRYVVSGEAYASPTGDRWNLADVAAPSGHDATNIKLVGQGGHLLGRREWQDEDGADSALQSYIDYQDIDAQGEIRQKRTTVDLDYQRRLLLGARNDFIWGVGYRYSRDDIVAQDIFTFTPQRASQTLASVFVQDEFALVPDQLRLIAGARLEHNNYTGLEPQPNLRAVWTPTSRQSVWAAASRAVHTPSRADESAQLNLLVIPPDPPQSPLPVLLRTVPSRDGLTDSEKVNTFEFGYRRQLAATLSLDAAAFYSRYNNIRSAALSSRQVVLQPVPYVLQLINPVAAIDAHTRGFELTVDWQPAPEWRLQPSYSYLDVSGFTSSSDVAVQSDALAQNGTAPVQQISLRTSWTPGARQQWDLWLRHVGRLENADGVGTPIAAYSTLDARFALRPLPALELSLVGQNLLRDRHVEFAPDLLPSVMLQVERSFYLKARYQF